MKRSNVLGSKYVYIREIRHTIFLFSFHYRKNLFFSRENDISKGYQKAIGKDIFFSLSALLRLVPSPFYSKLAHQEA